MLLATLLLASTPPPTVDEDGPIRSVRMIWDGAPHNAFTDLIRFDGRWFCCFREGAAHVSPDGAARVIASADGRRWESAASLTSDLGDVRDPKLCETPDGRLLLTAAVALAEPDERGRHQSMAWFSDNGSDWDGPTPIGERGVWLWRVTWHEGVPYAVGYATDADRDARFVRLYRGVDGRADRFEVLVPRLFDGGQPSEATLRFGPGGEALCLLRRDGPEPSARLGRAAAPYTEWSWDDLGVRLGGPDLIRWPDGRWIAAGRLYDGGARTALGRLDPDRGTFDQWLALPSGGDTSYPGLVARDGRLWVSYYSSHEGGARIYLAIVEPPSPPVR